MASTGQWEVTAITYVGVTYPPLRVVLFFFYGALYIFPRYRPTMNFLRPASQMSGAGGVPGDDGGDPYPLPTTAAELRERRLAYLAKTHPTSSEQGRVADPVAAEAPRPEVVSISSTSSSAGHRPH
jgi:hypothetical protein